MEFYIIYPEQKQQIKIDLQSYSPPYYGFYDSMVMTTDGTIFINNGDVTEGSLPDAKPIFLSIKADQNTIFGKQNMKNTNNGTNQTGSYAAAFLGGNEGTKQEENDI